MLLGYRRSSVGLGTSVTAGTSPRSCRRHGAKTHMRTARYGTGVLRRPERAAVGRSSYDDGSTDERTSGDRDAKRPFKDFRQLTALRRKKCVRYTIDYQSRWCRCPRHGDSYFVVPTNGARQNVISRPTRGGVMEEKNARIDITKWRVRRVVVCDHYTFCSSFTFFLFGFPSVFVTIITYTSPQFCFSLCTCSDNEIHSLTRLVKREYIIKRF